MKTKEEIYFDKMCDEYKLKFGKEYVIFATDTRTSKEHIDVIKRAIQTNKPVEQQKCKPNAVY